MSPASSAVRQRAPILSIVHESAIAPARLPRRRAACPPVRRGGPILSIVHASAVAPVRLTRPSVGGSPAPPENAAGVAVEPHVSEPMAKGTSPAATAEPGPLDEPPLQYSRFHG